jgi:hypothetical protein
MASIPRSISKQNPPQHRGRAVVQSVDSTIISSPRTALHNRKVGQAANRSFFSFIAPFHCCHLTADACRSLGHLTPSSLFSYRPHTAMSAPLLLPTLLRSLRPLLQKPLVSPLIARTTSSRLTRSRTFTSTRTQHNNTKMASSTSFLDAVANRRSIYALNKTSPISDDKLESIVTQVLYPRFE